MAFLDNSGDIILDAVLTDAGRQRMARGDFKIVKFALGDEEINYGNWNSSHPSGSAYYDLSLMQTPVLEAFTNNTSLMKTKLMSLNRNNVLFMPKLVLNDKATPYTQGTPEQNTKIGRQTFSTLNIFVMLADTNTVTNGNSGQNSTPIYSTRPGVIPGTTAADGANVILVDQGIDGANELPITTPFPNDMKETAYMVKVDHRLLRLDGVKKTQDPNAAANGDFERLAHSFVDDDAIATYYISTGDAGFLDNSDRHISQTEENRINSAKDAEAFVGPLGTRLCIAPRSSEAVKHSDGFFDEFGSINNSAIATQLTEIGTAHKYIDTTINVVGVTTGYSLDIPVRIVKKI